MRIALLSGAFPPDPDGIGDYSWWLSKTLSECGHEVTVFTSDGTKSEPALGVDVVAFFNPQDSSTLTPLPDLLKENDFEWLVVQYNPFSFGNRGFCPGLVRVLKKIKSRSELPRIAIMFHETKVPRWPWRFAIMHLWQNRIFKQLCRLADVSFASTERYKAQVERVAGSALVFHLVVGSNIPVCSLTQAQAREALDLSKEAVILGVFGNAHVSRLVDWIGVAAQAAYARDPKVMVLYIGPDGPAVAKHMGHVPFRDLGRLPKEEVAVGLKAMDLLLAPLIDGVSTRRGSIVAGIVNGVRVVTTRTDWTDRLIHEIPTVFTSGVEQGRNAFVKEVARVLSGSMKRKSETVDFDWKLIAKRLTNILSQA